MVLILHQNKTKQSQFMKKFSIYVIVMVKNLLVKNLLVKNLLVNESIKTLVKSFYVCDQFQGACIYYVQCVDNLKVVEECHPPPTNFTDSSPSLIPTRPSQIKKEKIVHVKQLWADRSAEHRPRPEYGWPGSNCADENFFAFQAIQNNFYFWVKNLKTKEKTRSII